MVNVVWFERQVFHFSHLMQDKQPVDWINLNHVGPI